MLDTHIYNLTLFLSLIQDLPLIIALNFTGAKQQLLYKLRRFEKLAELDPVELERRMHDEEDEEEDESFMKETLRKENDYREVILKGLWQIGRAHV